MNAKKCDRCGDYYDNHRDYMLDLKKVDRMSGTLLQVDLCKQCSEELFDWFQVKAEESEDKNGK